MSQCDALAEEADADVMRRTLAAYELWAPSYQPVPHNPLMQVEQAAMRELWPAVAGKRALDLACGTGRYTKLLSESNAKQVLALDFSAAMLRQVTNGARVQGSMMQLPFIAAAFDVVISGLALGHAPELTPWMSEIGRVLDNGGALLYSDFHPEAARVGMVRSFKDESSRTITVPHCVHPIEAQCDAIDAAGMIVEALHEIRVGREFQEVFPGSDAFYREWDGLPLALVVRARK